MFDLRRSLRRIKPHRFTRPLPRRPKAALSYVPAAPEPGRDLVLDTCVYIDVLQGNTPPEVDALLRLRTSNHLAVCVAELTHGFGRLDPRHLGPGRSCDRSRWPWKRSRRTAWKPPPKMS